MAESIRSDSGRAAYPGIGVFKTLAEPGGYVGGTGDAVVADDDVCSSGGEFAFGAGWGYQPWVRDAATRCGSFGFQGSRTSIGRMGVLVEWA